MHGLPAVLPEKDALSCMQASSATEPEDLYSIDVHEKTCDCRDTTNAICLWLSSEQIAFVHGIYQLATYRNTVYITIYRDTTNAICSWLSSEQIEFVVSVVR